MVAAGPLSLVPPPIMDVMTNVRPRVRPEPVVTSGRGAGHSRLPAARPSVAKMTTLLVP